MDNNLCPGFLLSHSGNLLVKFFYLCFDYADMGGEFLFRECIDGGKGQVSPAVPLDAGNYQIRWCLVVAEYIVDSVTHVVDVSVVVNGVTGSVDHNCPLGSLWWGRDGFLFFASLSGHLCPCVWFRFCVGVFRGRVLGLWFWLTCGVWASTSKRLRVTPCRRWCWCIGFGQVSVLSSHFLDLLFKANLSLFEVVVLGLYCSNSVGQGGDQFRQLFDFGS